MSVPDIAMQRMSAGAAQTPKIMEIYGVFGAYREAIAGIPEAHRTLARGGRYMSIERMTVEDVRTVLEATDRLARALVAGAK
jgi:hypothetical protein